MPRRSAAIAHGPSTQPSTSSDPPASLLQQRHRFDPVAHPSRGRHVGKLQRRQPCLVFEKGTALDDRPAAGYRTTPPRLPGRTTSRAGSEIAET